MGSLSGHILPGSFFLLFGLWWSWSVFHKYFLSLKEAKKGEGLTRRRKRNSRYTNTVSYPCFACKRIPIEGIIKLAVCTIGLIGKKIKQKKFTLLVTGNDAYLGFMA
ncbi:Transmembrane protein 45B [Armadillidium nasatum]|uniref:Transmembrane protein 45B n=1 Tax=Armadillidium nasatum TaxID=96803 RepID=A0A5N5T8U6_9CRUS|nr:Transmembrane protein 45B [Armadillidium nasatum]